MNAERFAVILEAYGGEPRRWPAAGRRSAESFAATIEGRQLLADALDLDFALDRHRVMTPSPELRARVLEAAPGGRSPGWRSAWGHWLAWAPGAGLAAAGVAGVLFGAALSDGWADPRTRTLLNETDGFDVAVLSADQMDGAL